ncbi:MAG: DMT family transporter [Thalassobaculales bacterium]
MEPLQIAAALLSALLHAGWNAAVKADRDPARAMTAQMALSGLIGLPGLVWTGLPAAAAWPWIAASTAINLLTVNALLRAYALGGFGIVYPFGRAVAVVLVVPLAAVVAGDLPGPAAIAGVAMIAVSLAALAGDGSRDGSLSRPALGWTLAAGAGTAAYILCDAQGVRASGSPLAYGFVVAATNGAAMCWRRRRAGPPWRQLRGYWGIGLPTALAAMASYLLILWVWSGAPIAPAAALRDTSAVFAILIAVVWLKEAFTRRRLAAVLLAAAAVPLLRLG